jgi:hypothetical protein
MPVENWSIKTQLVRHLGMTLEEFLREWAKLSPKDKDDFLTWIYNEEQARRKTLRG